MGNGVTANNTATVTQQDVIDSLTEQLAKAKERIAELESALIDLRMSELGQSLEDAEWHTLGGER